MLARTWRVAPGDNAEDDWDDECEMEGKASIRKAVQTQTQIWF